MMRNTEKGPLRVNFTFTVFDIFQQVYVQVIDLCTFRSEMIHDRPKIRFRVAVPFNLTSQFGEFTSKLWKDLPSIIN